MPVAGFSLNESPRWRRARRSAELRRNAVAGTFVSTIHALNKGRAAARRILRHRRSAAGSRRTQRLLKQLREWGLKISPLLRVVQGAAGVLAEHYRDVGAKRATLADTDRRVGSSTR